MGDRARRWRITVGERTWRVVAPDGAVHEEPAIGSGLPTLVWLLRSVTGLPVGEHHILAAHGEGIFSGLDGDPGEWLPRVRALLHNLDRLGEIVAEWPAGHQMMSRTELMARGWNDATVAALIRPAARLPNPHYLGGGDMVLFDTRSVLALERTGQWFALSARLRHRRAFAAHDPRAPRPVRAAGMQVAARDPGRYGPDLAAIAVRDASAAVRALAREALQRYWWDRTWRDEDLDDPAMGPVAALLGPQDVLAAALQHTDPAVVAVASGRTVLALAG